MVGVLSLAYSLSECVCCTNIILTFRRASSGTVSGPYNTKSGGCHTTYYYYYGWWWWEKGTTRSLCALLGPKHSQKVSTIHRKIHDNRRVRHNEDSDSFIMLSSFVREQNTNRIRRTPKKTCGAAAGLAEKEVASSMMTYIYYY
jgi:hypothetical protein